MIGMLNRKKRLEEDESTKLLEETVWEGNDSVRGDEGEAADSGRDRGDEEEEALQSISDEAPEENPVQRARRGPSPECSEPRLQQTTHRLVDEILTFLAEAAQESEQMDKAIAGMGIALRKF